MYIKCTFDAFKLLKKDNISVKDAFIVKNCDFLPDTAVVQADASPD